MKLYEQPLIVIVAFEEDDVVRTSGEDQKDNINGLLPTWLD